MNCSGVCSWLLIASTRRSPSDTRTQLPSTHTNNDVTLNTPRCQRRQCRRRGNARCHRRHLRRQLAEHQVRQQHHQQDQQQWQRSHNPVRVVGDPALPNHCHGASWFNIGQFFGREIHCAFQQKRSVEDLWWFIRYSMSILFLLSSLFLPAFPTHLLSVAFYAVGYRWCRNLENYPCCLLYIAFPWGISLSVSLSPPPLSLFYLIMLVVLTLPVHCSALLKCESFMHVVAHTFSFEWNFKKVLDLISSKTCYPTCRRDRTKVLGWNI